MTTLETNRLRLRRFETDDWQALARLYADDMVMRYMQSGRGLSRTDAESRARGNISNFNDHWRRRGFGVWAVTDKASGRLLGQCGLRHVDEARDVEILYLLNKTMWGKGLATEAASVALDYGLKTLGLDRIIGLVRPENTASRRVLEKLGLRFERIAPIWQMECCWYAVGRAASLEPEARAESA
jgi:[ribosomal protein S5]-alanine N-acetyltransferase